MRKIKLDIDSLRVESFDLESEANGPSTIQGYAEAVGGAEPATNSPSCPTNGCGTCYETCWKTCAYTCEGTTGGTETQWYSCNPCDATTPEDGCYITVNEA
jgi:hypothetical protein